MWTVWLLVVSAHAVSINEVLPDPPGADAGQEWVELWSDVDAEIGGWQVEAATRPGLWTTVVYLPEGLRIGAEEPMLVAPWSLTDHTNVLPFVGTLGNASTDADAVRLVDATGRVVDVLAYGAGAGLFPEARGQAEKPASGQSVARVPDGGRHVEVAVPSPGARNPAPASCVPGLPGSVLLTELLVDPDGADAGQEWLEIRVVAGPRDLAGWAIEQASTPVDWGKRVRFVFPDASTADAGARLVVADADADVDTPWRVARGKTLGLGNGEDAVRLVDCAGRVVDTVLYGDDNTDAFAEDDGSQPVDAAPSPRSGACLARAPETHDSDRSSEDWILIGRCSPGAPSGLPDADVVPTPEPTGCSSPVAGRPPLQGRARSSGAPPGLGLLLWGVYRRRARERQPG